MSARDAEHLRNEVEMLRKRVSDREDEVLELMEEREQLQARRDGLAAERDEATAHTAATEAAIKKEWSAIDAQVATLEEKRSGMASSLDPDLVALYEEVRAQKEGIAAVPFVDRICGGCHLTHSAGEEVQVMKKTPPRCIHCRRILVPQ